MAELGRLDVAVKNREPALEVREPLEVAAERQPVRFGRSRGKPVGDCSIVELVEQARVDELDLVRVEMGWRPAEGREVEAFGELVERGDRLDRLRSADSGEHVEQRHWLDPFVAQMLGAVRAEPLRELALGGDQQRLVRELRRLAPSASNIWICTALLET